MNEIQKAANFILKIKSGCSLMFGGRANDLSQAHECREVAMAVDNGEFMEHVKALRAAANCSPKIKMTKTLPVEAGRYYFAESEDHYMEIVEVYAVGGGSDSLVFREGERYGSVGFTVGYWAKVDESMFEFKVE